MSHSCLPRLAGYVVAVLLAAWPAVAGAQPSARPTPGSTQQTQLGEPQFEVFVGVSHLPGDGDDYPRQNSAGFQASVAANLNRWFGVVADLGGHYGSAWWYRGTFEPPLTTTTSVHQFLFGPRLTGRADKVAFFAHFLVGRAIGDSGIRGFSESGFAMDGGG